jgi:hypothetical protein
MVGQLAKLIEKVDKSNTDQGANGAYEHKYTLVSKTYLNYI